MFTERQLSKSPSQISSDRDERVSIASGEARTRPKARADKTESLHTLYQGDTRAVPHASLGLSEAAFSEKKRVFFRNLKRESDEERRPISKNARHAVLSKQQVGLIYHAIQAGESVASLYADQFLQDTSDERERELLVETLFTQKSPRDVLVASNQKFLIDSIKPFKYKGIDEEELYTTANLGLLRAIETFDPGLDYEFGTYAIHWINHALRVEVAKRGRTIAIPRDVYVSYGKARTLRDKQEKVLGRAPSAQEFQAYLHTLEGFSEGTIDFIITDLFAKRFTPASLDKPVSRLAKTPRSLGEKLPDHKNSTEEQAVENVFVAETQKLLADVFIQSKLTENEKRVLSHRFELFSSPEKTRLELAAMLKISSERVRQIENAALGKLRSFPALHQQLED